jgi:hypothetical protein
MLPPVVTSAAWDRADRRLAPDKDLAVDLGGVDLQDSQAGVAS